MGLLSPAAYDALLLEKVKLLLQSALQNPKRRGPPASYEHFVEALDVHDESANRVMEVLLYETTTRRPRKLPTSASDPVASTSTSSARRARDAHDDSYSRLSRRGPLISFSDSDSDSDDASTFVPHRSSRLRPVGIRARRSDEGPSPSLQLRQQQIDELFGYTDPLPSFSQVLSDFSSSSPAASQPASSVTISSSSHSPSSADLPTFEELWNILLDDPFPSSSVTTFASFLSQLNASSFSPSPLISNTMPALLRELSRRDPAIPIRVRNAIRRRGNPSGSGSGSGTSLPSFREFLQQDPPSEGMNAYEQQELARLRRELNSSFDRFNGTANRINIEHGGEGIWHTSFVEHLEDGSEREVPVDLDDEVEVRPALTFVEHARRRRAERRQREEEGATASPQALSSTLGSMDVDSLLAATATPSITVTSASTPATSAAASPPSSSTACPPSSSSASSSAPPHPPPPPRTSASIAEDHFRRQRRIARLPSPSPALPASSPVAVSSSPDVAARDASRIESEAGRNPSLRAVVDALSRSRAQRLRAARANGDTGGADVL
ncbi:hypothetical protein JCM11251_007813 [Rhodosporidiobolus azoricus]